MISRIRRDWFGLAGFDCGESHSHSGGFLYLLEEVGSTSDFLLGRGDVALGRLCRFDGWGWQAGQTQRLQSPVQARKGSIAVARRQTAGRGRLGRRWLGDGGLQMSWLLDVDGAEVGPGLAVWIGLICALVLRKMTGLPVGLKWPNDLRLEGRKLGGILLDRVQLPESRIVAGLGLNVGSLPADLAGDARARAIALPAGRWPDGRISGLAAGIIHECDARLPEFRAAGWSAFRDLFAELDETRNRQIRLASAGSPMTGIAEGIDDIGALRLRDEAGRIHQVVAGDVHILDMGE